MAKARRKENHHGGLTATSGTVGLMRIEFLA